MKLFLPILIIVNIYANSDFKLLKLAYSNGLRPVPINFNSLLAFLKTEELPKEKTILGKKLFFDKNLSLDRDISCASCHNLSKAGIDNRIVAIGHKNQKNPFHLNTPTVLNTLFSKKFFWNGRSNSLENQAKGPLQATFEMSITPKLAKQRIIENKKYIKLFKNAYENSEITFEKIVNAISIYERTLITKGRYDEFLLGDFNALSNNEKEGLELFIKKGCVGCHNGMGLGGQTLRKFPLVYHTIWSMSTPKKIQTLQKRYNNILNSIELKKTDNKLNFIKSQIGKKDFQLFKNGFFNQINKSKVLKTIYTKGCKVCHKKDSNEIKDKFLTKIAFPFKNTGNFLGAKNSKYFRVPLLRNIVRTKPYFHNGSINKLEDAIKIMGIHQSRVNLTNKDISNIILFLKSVDGNIINFNK